MTNDQNRLRERALSLLAEFVANTLRVVRGSGRPADVAEDAIRLGVAMVEAIQAGAEIGDHDVTRTLLLESRHFDILPTDNIIRGSLQFAAASLLKQTSHMSRAETEIYDGIKLWNDVRAGLKRRGDADA